VIGDPAPREPAPGMLRPRPCRRAAHAREGGRLGESTIGRHAAEPLKVIAAFGTRPEAIKMAPLVLEMRSRPHEFEPSVVVTAQHREMLDQVLDHFRIPPDIDLDIMRPDQSLADVTVRALERLGPVLRDASPDLLLVHGDTTTTFACALAAFYRKIPVGHVEAGLRSFEKYLPYPEEMNRKLTAQLADLHFAPTATARGNLLREGVDPGRVFVTGNTAIDALRLTVDPGYSFRDPDLTRLDFERSRVVVVDVHRRENLGEPMRAICSAVARLADSVPDVLVVFSVHRNPHVEEVVREALTGRPGILLKPPMDYPEWANLLGRAYLAVSDSGGVQEEAPALGTPVVLLRDVTERPEAIDAGTVRLAGTRTDAVYGAVRRLLDTPPGASRTPRVTRSGAPASDRRISSLERASPGRTGKDIGRDARSKVCGGPTAGGLWRFTRGYAYAIMITGVQEGLFRFCDH